MICYVKKIDLHEQFLSVHIVALKYNYLFNLN